MNLEYDSLNQQLLERFPALRRPGYTQLIGGIEAGPYIVFGVIFNQYLIDLAAQNDLTALSAVSAFMEEMAAAKDGRVSDMFESEVLPTLVGSPLVADAYWPLLGMAVRRRLMLLSPRIIGEVRLPSEKK